MIRNGGNANPEAPDVRDLRISLTDNERVRDEAAQRLIGFAAEGWTGAGAQAHPSAVGTQLPQDFPEYEVGNVELTD